MPDPEVTMISSPARAPRVIALSVVHEEKSRPSVSDFSMDSRVLSFRDLALTTSRDERYGVPDCILNRSEVLGLKCSVGVLVPVDECDLDFTSREDRSGLLYSLTSRFVHVEHQDNLFELVEVFKVRCQCLLRRLSAQRQRDHRILPS
ncbi:hypothetical protein [Enterobacter phage 04_vB_Eclo_IJM]|nr:hypothetical protein [Enterobacter phage 04_vB_Eclo_IJM]